MQSTLIELPQLMTKEPLLKALVIIELDHIVNCSSCSQLFMEAHELDGELIGLSLEEDGIHVFYQQPGTVDITQHLNRWKAGSTKH